MRKSSSLRKVPSILLFRWCCSLLILVSIPPALVYLGFWMTYRPRLPRSSSASTKLPTWSSGSPLLSVRCMGGLGNQLFQYAALTGIAERNNRLATLPSYCALRTFFPSLRQVPFVDPDHTWKTLVESRSPDEKLLRMTDREPLIFVHGFLQSHAYFAETESLVRKQLRFDDSISAAAKLWMRSRNLSSRSIVGVHVRRGDFLNAESRNRGYTVASADFVQRHVQAALARLGNASVLVASDDITWCRQTLSEHPDVFYSETGSALLDMALLANCVDVIITGGTFGWWAAWLSGARHVTYDANFPRPNSEIANGSDFRKYYPEHWTAGS